jgi:hypothetical protein
VPDLSPDTSIYQHEGLGGMTLPGLMSLVQSSRALQTQSAVSDAIRASGGDLNAASKMLMRPDAPGFMTPELAGQLAHASGAVTGTKMEQLRRTADMVAYHADDADLNHDKVTNLVMNAVQGGVPADQAANFLSSLPPPSGNRQTDRKNLQRALVGWQSTLTGGQPPAMDTVAGRGGEPVPVSPTEKALMQRGLQAAPGTNDVLTAPGTGRAMSTVPSATATTIKTSGDMAADLLGGGPRRAQTTAMLQTLDELGKATEISAPTADIEKRLKQLWQRAFGNENSPAAKDLASAEGYNKIANMITSQMATSSHPSDAFLHNAYGANPQLDLSKLGRAGMTHYLQGTNDAEGRIASEWENWISANQGQEGRYLSWLNGKEPGSTVDIKQFDPRVFQYAKMSQDERVEFRKQMTDAQRKTLNQHAEDYQKRGWVNFNPI